MAEFTFVRQITLWPKFCPFCGATTLRYCRGYVRGLWECENPDCTVGMLFTLLITAVQEDDQGDAT